ncbi:NAD(P)/FAD-dependent oxidoreductase [Miniphocaeibacter halophilus]|uniref:NAD(P)/FAD-dependent oxidoreductase n=2 Tax=Miniphocaeibacter halophilus TaxID=2931922 RepID=A0AC61MZZ9_9FIRM|nr:NAD(P)/FAD-dependent oxidoreductase [Miniphocaeibacter halophilus]
MKYDLIIIGAGPAGVSSALYATSRGLKTLVLEQDENAGGTLKKVSNITHFTGFMTGETGSVFSKTLDEQLKQCGAKVLQKKVTAASLKGEDKEIICNEEKFLSKAVIIAAGTSQNTPDFEILEELKNKHLHNDARKYYKDYENVIVIGGSDGAAKEALFLSQNNKHVDLIIREEKLGAVPEFSQPILNSNNINIHTNSVISKVSGRKNIEEIKIKNTLTSEEEILNFNNCGIFYYIGSKPNTEVFKEVELNKGYITVDEKMKTNINGVYAVGDIRVKEVRQISTAVSDGALAAIDASKYINAKK